MRLRRGGRSIALIALLVLGGCQAELFTGLPEGEANEMIALLLRHGVQASKTEAKDGTDTILVDRAQFADAVDLLHARGYPRQTFETMGQVFQQSGLVASPTQERARFLWALGQELSETVAQIDGVLTARVQVVLPDNDLLSRNPTPSSASVFLRYDTRSDVTRLVPQIKMLVADSVQGLSYDKVSVVLVPVARTDQTPTMAPRGDALAGTLGGAAAGGSALLVLGLAAFILRRRITSMLASLRVPATGAAE